MITARALRLSTICSTRLAILAPLALAFACGGGTDLDDLNKQNWGTQAGSSSTPTAGQAGSSTTTGGQPPATGGSGSVPTAGSGTTTPTAGTGGASSGGTGTMGGSSSQPMGGGGSGVGGGGGGSAPIGPYAPRTGSFNMLVYSQNVTGGYKHPSIKDGQDMLKAIGQTQGFQVTVATDESEITPTGLAKYEIVFFMSSTGEIFSAEQRKTYEDWIKNNGAYAGMHAAADTAQSWTFYKEMTGQYYDLHDPCCATADIRWTAQGETHITAKGIPNPWTRAEEWYKFNKHQDWSTKAGFTILSTVTTTGGGTRPVSFVREWGNFRSFYTSLGHESSPYKDASVIKHVSAGIMWAVRREALIK